MVLGLAIGLTLFYVVIYLEQRGRWEQLDTPPGEIMKLVAADEDQVIVETAVGTLYEVYCQAKEPEEICWEEVEPPVDAFSWPCDDEILLPPPGPVRDEIEFCIQHEYLSLNRYALLEDGTLWRWEVFIYPLGQVGRLFQTIVISAILGAVAGVIILVIRG
jgi:hypothetical protein